MTIHLVAYMMSSRLDDSINTTLIFIYIVRQEFRDTGTANDFWLSGATQIETP